MFKNKDRNSAIVKVTLKKPVVVTETIPAKSEVVFELPDGKVPAGNITGKLSDGRSITIPKDSFESIIVITVPGEAFNDRQSI